MSRRNWAEMTNKPHVYACENTYDLKHSFYKFGNSGVLHRSCVFIQNWILPLEFFSSPSFNLALIMTLFAPRKRPFGRYSWTKPKFDFDSFWYMLNLQQFWLPTSYPEEVRDFSSEAVVFSGKFQWLSTNEVYIYPVGTSDPPTAMGHLLLPEQSQI